MSTCAGPDWILGSRARVCCPRARLEQQVDEARNAVTERTQENEDLQERLRSAQVPAMCLIGILTLELAHLITIYSITQAFHIVEAWV